MRILFSSFLILTLIVNMNVALATSSAPPNPGTGSVDAAQATTNAQGGPGGICDLTQYKESLFGTESKTRCTSSCPPTGYQCVNGINATGKYQFMPTTAPSLNAYKSAPTACKVMGKCAQGLASGSAACNQVQENLMDEFTMKNLKWLKSNCPGAVAAVTNKKTIKGYKVSASGVKTYGEPCTTSWSGLLAGAHLGGAQGICNTISSAPQGDVDDSEPGKRGGTSRLWYVCKHKDLPVPEADCNPKPGTPAASDPQGYGEWPKGYTPPARGPISFNALGDILKYYWVASFQLMTEQLTTTMIHQVQIIGSLFDAKHQAETQRIMQQKYAQAHKDYQPSTQMCEIGTFVRNLSDTQERAKLSESALNRSMLDRALATGDVKTGTVSGDEETRVQAYVDKFCNVEDNAKQNEKLCKKSGTPEQQNADINFTTTIDAPLTLEIDLLDGDTKPDEENLFAFLDYIFMHDKFPWISANQTELFAFIEPYQDMRSLVAMRSVAYNSFANIIAQKTQGPKNEEDASKGPISVAPFLKALMREMGMEDNDIEKTIGENPSYYAQMEILTKKIYQHPEFISDLYDKPANVKRLRAAMTAIKLMQDRDIHDAMQRREMLMSMLLELKLREKQQELLNGSVGDVLANPPGEPNKPGTYGSGSQNGLGVGTFNPATGAGGF